MSFQNTYNKWIEDKTNWKVRVSSRTKDKKFYIVRLLDKDYWICTCPALKECNHIQRAKEFYGKYVND